MELENLKDNSNEWGGARNGAGRPEGSENEDTKQKREAKKYIKQRIINSVESLINSQMNLAKGVQMLYKIHTETKDKGIKIKSKPELVTSQHEIENYLAGEYDDEDDDYYFITTERPDNKALDSLLDRTFGKSRQDIGLDGGLDDNDKPKPLLYAVQNNIGHPEDTETNQEN